MLGVSWVVRGLASAQMPLLDLGTLQPGDFIRALAAMAGLSPEGLFKFARFLAGTKLLLAGYLLVAAISGLFNWLTCDEPDDALPEATLWLTAIVTLVAFAGAAAGNPAGLPMLSAELLLCVQASAVVVLTRPAPLRLSGTNTADVTPVPGPVG